MGASGRPVRTATSRSHDEKMYCIPLGLLCEDGIIAKEKIVGGFLTALDLLVSF